MPARTATPFRHIPTLPKLPEGADRAIVQQFRAVQNDLDSLRGRPSSASPVISAKNVTAAVGGLLLIAPPVDGMLVGLPQGRAELQNQVIKIAVVGGFLSPGATLSIIGNRGTINGQATLPLNSCRLVELTCVGELGWWYST